MPHSSIRALAALAMVSLGFVGCATVPDAKRSDPRYLLERACGVGQTNASVKGSVWMAAKSKEASGQFPASVVAEAPGKLRLEVTNLLGGTEALITIEQDRYEVKTPSKKPSGKQQGVGNWGGIPLRWATELFLGRVPCPRKPVNELKLTSPEPGVLRVEETLDAGAQETFEYTFRSWGQDAWPESAVWERTGILAAKVRFKFDDPNEGDASPKKWEAHSDRGEVKVRWKERSALPR